MQRTIRLKHSLAPLGLGVFLPLHGHYTFLRHGASFISSPTLIVSSEIRRGGICYNLRGTSAQFVCASHVWKTTTPEGNLKAVVTGFCGEASLLWVKTTVEGIISKYRTY